MRSLNGKTVGPIGVRGESVSVSELKAKCLSYVEAARSKGKRFVITKRGVPVAKLVPLEDHLPSPLGIWKGLVEIEGDIVHTDWSDLFECLSD